MRNYDTAPAVACLGGILLDILRTDAPTLSQLEGSAAEAGVTYNFLRTLTAEHV